MEKVTCEWVEFMDYFSFQVSRKQLAQKLEEVWDK